MRDTIEIISARNINNPNTTKIIIATVPITLDVTRISGAEESFLMAEESASWFTVNFLLLFPIDSSRVWLISVQTQIHDVLLITIFESSFDTCIVDFFHGILVVGFDVMNVDILVVLDVVVVAEGVVVVVCVVLRNLIEGVFVDVFAVVVFADVVVVISDFIVIDVVVVAKCVVVRGVVLGLLIIAITDVCAFVVVITVESVVVAAVVVAGIVVAVRVDVIVGFIVVLGVVVFADIVFVGIVVVKYIFVVTIFVAGAIFVVDVGVQMSGLEGGFLLANIQS